MPGGAALYFTYISFFISAPILLAWALDRYPALCEKTVVRSTMIGKLGMVGIFGLFSIFGDAYEKSFLSIHNIHKEDELVSELMSLKNDYANQTNLIFDKSLIFATSTHSHCAAKPFLYPAITEHPWIGVIEKRSDCKYHEYGYQMYLKEGHLISPVVPKSMKILNRRSVD